MLFLNSFETYIERLLNLYLFIVCLKKRRFQKKFYRLKIRLKRYS